MRAAHASPGSTLWRLLRPLRSLLRPLRPLLRPLRSLLRPLLLSAVVLLTGPLMLYIAAALGSPVHLTWSSALASLRTTGPLAGVMFAVLLLLDWQSPSGADR
jgi:hypothetical protein